MSSSPRRRNLLEQRVERIFAQSPGQEDPSDLAERVQSVLACVPPEARSLISERTGRSLAEVEAIMESDPALRADHKRSPPGHDLHGEDVRTPRRRSAASNGAPEA